ncbi:MAG TPA: DUF2231 domain-containing protein [Ktedonobacterales bacterium]
MPVIRAAELHPIIIHFPIALLLTSVLLDFLAVSFRRSGLADAATWLLVFGVPSAAAALLSGVLSERYVTIGAAGDILHYHKVAAVGASGLFGLLLVLRLVWLAPRLFPMFAGALPAARGAFGVGDAWLRRALPELYAPRLPRVAIGLYLALSLVAVALLAITGYLGGALVYDHGVGASGFIAAPILAR